MIPKQAVGKIAVFRMAYNMYFPTTLSVDTQINLFQVQRKKESKSKEMAFAMRQRGYSHDTQQQYIMYPLWSRRRGSAFRLFTIQVADKNRSHHGSNTITVSWHCMLFAPHSCGIQHSFPNGSQHYVSTTLTFHTQINLFQLQSIKEDTNGWLWPLNNVVILSANIINILCFSCEGRKLGTAFRLYPITVANKMAAPAACKIICFTAVSVYTQVEIVQLQIMFVLMLCEQPLCLMTKAVRSELLSFFLSFCNRKSFIWAYGAQWCRKRYRTSDWKSEVLYRPNGCQPK